MNESNIKSANDTTAAASVTAALTGTETTAAATTITAPLTTADGGGETTAGADVEAGEKVPSGESHPDGLGGCGGRPAQVENSSVEPSEDTADETAINRPTTGTEPVESSEPTIVGVARPSSRLLQLASSDPVFRRGRINELENLVKLYRSGFEKHWPTCRLCYYAQKPEDLCLLGRMQCESIVCYQIERNKYAG